MINKIALAFSKRVALTNNHNLLQLQRFNVHDWSHIYDGIYKF